MTKKYLRKSYIEKNSRDTDKLSKAEKRSFQKSFRQESKKLAEIAEEDADTDEYYEMENMLANRCYLISLFSDEYKCTCPNPESELATEHLEYLNREIIRLGEKDEQE